METKILTINTWKCEGIYRNRMAILLDQLKQADAHIILCQECFYSEESSADTAGWLAGHLNMYASFVPCRPKKRFFEGRWVHSFSGMAVLSRFPPIFQESLELSGAPLDRGRKIQQVVYGISPGKKLLITNLHLTHLPDQPLRQKQVQEICQKLESASYDISLIGGDFNADLDSEAIALLRNRLNAADCYVLGAGREPRTSLVESLKKEKPLCVDHLFCLPLKADLPGPLRYPAFKGASVILNESHATEGIYPSDHFGISVTLETE